MWKFKCENCVDIVRVTEKRGNFLKINRRKSCFVVFGACAFLQTEWQKKNFKKNDPDFDIIF